MKAAGTTDPAALALALTDFANASGGVDNITTVFARLETGQNAADTPPDTTPEIKTEGESDG
jgi:serine/threonine protein phosphatase PrpC